MTTSGEDIRNRQERAAEWISEAEKHMRAAKSLLRHEGLQNIVLYHLQQSMEMGTKGLGRASGIPHHELRTEFGHNNLFLLVKIVQAVVDSMDGHKLISEVLASFHREGKNYDSAKHIQNVLEATASPRRARAFGSKQYASEVFTSGMRMPPEEVKFMLDSFDRIASRMQVPPQATRLIHKLTADPIYFQLPTSSINWTDDIVRQATEKLLSRVGRHPDQAEVEFLQSIARNIPNPEGIETELKANQGKPYKFDFGGYQLVEQAIGIPHMLLANLGLLIIGSLVWAHESYPRYPAEPDAPDSIEQAARERKLGVKHYTDEMGVIRHIKPLTAKADKAIRLLKSGYKAGYLLMSAKDAKS